MCGRFVRIKTIHEIADIFNIKEVESDLAPSYNIAPKQPIVVVMEDGKKKLVTMQWGLIPRWAKDDKISNKLINARSETIDQKPSFKNSFIHRRCIVVADGFYEWTERGGKKRPVYIYLESGQTFGMAGVYDTWKTSEGEEITTCTIITTEANEFMKKLHHRMPVILEPEYYDYWLNPENKDITKLKEILNKFISQQLDFHEVSSAVNSPVFNSPDCIKPL
jgi:putative SOS response-associated peptidase YedK